MTLRIGFIGAGNMSRQHAKKLAGLAGVEVVAVAHPRPEKTAAFTEAQPGEVEIFSDATIMCEKAGLDAVYVCIPPFAQDRLVELAAERGLHLFLEKPIALEIAHARRMVEAAEANGVITQAGFQFRFRQSVRLMKEAIDSGAAGRPTLFTGRYWTNMDGNPWWRDRAKSGGQVIEQLIHLYDLAAHFMGEADLDRTTGIVRNLCHQQREDYTIEDTSVGVHQMKNGGISVITGSNNALPGHFIADFRVVCEDALLDYHSTGQHWVQADSARFYHQGELQQEIAETEDVTLALNRDFIEAIRQSRPAAIPIQDGLRALEWVRAVMDGSGF